jgi:dihydrolipoamide dehydrogenase
MPNILPQVDTDITKRLTPSLKKKGIGIHTSTKVTRIEKEGEDYLLYCEDKKGEISIKAKAVLISVGRKPCIEGLNLDVLGIEHDIKGIKVDENCETNIKGIYAIGDVNGKTMLAHAASHQGIRTVEHIMNKVHNEGNEAIPNCIFIFPEIATVGISEDEAKQKELSYKTSKFMFGANGKALTLGEAEGMVKVISTRSDKLEEHKEEILGVHIMGPHASDLIHEAALALNNGMDVERIINTVHAHPTLSEAFSEAVMGLKGKAIHMVNSKK